MNCRLLYLQLRYTIGIMKVEKYVRLISFVGAGALTLAWLGAQPAFPVDDPFLDAGIRYYQKRDWRSAIYYLEQQVKKAPWDSKAMYYLALSYHSAGYRAKAKAMYQQIVDKYPGSAVFQNANLALKALNATIKKEADMAAHKANQSASGSPASSVPSSSAGVSHSTGVVNIVTTYPKATGKPGGSVARQKSGR